MRSAGQKPQANTLMPAGASSTTRSIHTSDPAATSVKVFVPVATTISGSGWSVVLPETSTVLNDQSPEQ